MQLPSVWLADLLIEHTGMRVESVAFEALALPRTKYVDRSLLMAC